MNRKPRVLYFTRESFWGSDLPKISAYSCATVHEFHMLHPYFNDAKIYFLVVDVYMELFKLS